MARYALIRTDGTWTTGNVDQSSQDFLTEVQGLVGGYIETVPLPGTDAVCFVNEEGTLLNLPANLAATRVIASAVPTWSDTIAGNMAVFGTDGDKTVDVPDDVIETITTITGQHPAI